MPNIEEKYVKNIDSAKRPPSFEIGDQGENAETAVIEFFKTLPGITIRLSTKAEDSGLEQIVKDPAIDAVGYINGKPAFVLQITTTTNRIDRKEKYGKDRLSRAWVRLPEMSPQDNAIPRILIFIDAPEINSFAKDHDLSKHPKLAQKIIDSFKKNLELSLLQKPLPKEQELINQLLNIVSQFETQKSRPN